MLNWVHYFSKRCDFFKEKRVHVTELQRWLVCFIFQDSRVRKPRKPEVFNVGGYEGRELPNIIWCSALLRLQLKNIGPSCLIPSPSASFFFVSKARAKLSLLMFQCMKQ